MNQIPYDNWIPGGVLRVYSRRRGVWHFGIAGATGASGPSVMHASKDRGQFVVTSYSEFAEGEQVEYTWLPESFERQQAVLTRAESQIGKAFKLLNADCEDYVNWIVTGVARSPQRERVALAALIVLVIGGVLSAK
jgi:hypothetical protein